MKNKRGMIQGVLVGVVTIIVAVILMVGVALPITKNTVTNQSLTGTDLTIGNSLTTFLLIGVLLLIVAISVGVARFGN